MIYRGNRHKEIFEKELRLHPQADEQFRSALYLLTADCGLWEQVQDNISIHNIDITAMRPKNLSSAAYVFFATAKDILTGSRIVSVTDLADNSLVSIRSFQVVCTALAIRGFGCSA